jgi:hypothetical protein
MAAVVAAGTATNTVNNSAVTVPGFTPTSGDLLVAVALVTGQGSGGTFSDNRSLGWTNIITAVKNTSGDSVVLAVANSLAGALSTTVTFTPAGGPTSSGVSISVMRVSGMSRTGLSAVRQSAKADNQPQTTPAATFSVAALTANPIIGAVANQNNPAGITPPSTWNEIHDQGYASPNSGLETVAKDSGFTGTTVTWGFISASALCCLIAELDTSAVTQTATAQVGTVTQTGVSPTGSASGSVTGTSGTGTVTSTGADAAASRIVVQTFSPRRRRRRG